MALIRCPECGKEVSSKVKKCIHCGYPIEEVINGQGDFHGDVRGEKLIDNISGDNCIISDANYSKTEIKKMIKNDTIFQFLINECKLSGNDAFRFMDTVRFYSNEVPTDYRIAFEELQEFNRKKVEEMNKFKPKIHCKYCGSDNVRKLGPFEKLAVQCIGKEWYCNKCHSSF